MIRRVLPLALCLIAVSAILGWLRAGTVAGERPPSADGWEQMQYAPPSKAEYKKMAAKLKASSLLPLSRIEERKINIEGAAESEETTSDVPDFPKVGGAKTVRNTRYVSLVGKDNTIVTIKAGDVLDSGWEIKSISPRSVLAVFDGQDLEIPINSYLQEAFEKPEEVAMDSENGPAGKTNKAAQKTADGGE